MDCCVLNGFCVEEKVWHSDMKSLKLFLFPISFLVVMSLPTMVFAERYAAVFCGSGGTVEFIDKFNDWGNRLHSVLIDDLSFDREKVRFFSADVDQATAIKADYCSLNAVKNYFSSLQETVTSNDELFLFFIGHGSYTAQDIMFHLPGDDIPASELNGWLDEISAKHMVIVNGSSSSAGFINFLSQENRIICTSTKNVSETNAPEYFEFLIQSLKDGSADVNRDERITVFELANQTAQLTQAWYDQNEYIASEHSLIDDNGDGLGTRLIPEDGTTEHQRKSNTTPQDGELANQVFIKDFQFPENAPKELIDQYLASLNQVAELKHKKKEMDSADYFQQLESYLIQAASIHQSIRSYQTSDHKLQSGTEEIEP